MLKCILNEPCAKRITCSIFMYPNDSFATCPNDVTYHTPSWIVCVYSLSLMNLISFTSKLHFTSYIIVVASSILFTFIHH